MLACVAVIVCARDLLCLVVKVQQYISEKVKPSRKHERAFLFLLKLIYCTFFKKKNIHMKTNKPLILPVQVFEPYGKLLFVVWLN